MLQRLRAQYVSVLLILGSVICLGVTVWQITTSGSLVYFLAFHSPFHVQLAAAAPASSQPALPSFQVQSAISQTELSPGDTLSIHVAVTPRQTTSAHLEIWVRGPKIREVYKYPKNEDATGPVQFVAGQTKVFDETYTLPANLPTGNYHVSTSIVSENRQVDYYNATNFASFTVL